MLPKGRDPSSALVGQRFGRPREDERYEGAFPPVHPYASAIGQGVVELPRAPVVRFGNAPVLQRPQHEVVFAAAARTLRIDPGRLPDRDMFLEYTLRVREHTEIIHEEGLNAPAAELDLRDPPVYAASLP